MKEFVISTTKKETAILVGLITSTQNERKTNEYLDELEFLAQTAGANMPHEAQRCYRQRQHPPGRRYRWSRIIRSGNL